MSILDDIDYNLDEKNIEDILKHDKSWILIHPCWGSSKYFSKQIDLTVDKKYNDINVNTYYGQINCIYFPSDYNDFYNINYLINDYKYSKIFTGIPKSLLYINATIIFKEFGFLFKPENILDINTDIELVKNYCKQKLIK